MTSKMDRRKKYTRMVLKDSLMELLRKKHISAITVKEICELADINRSTFYAHYSDHYDLLNKIEEEIIEDMQEKLNMYIDSKEDLLQTEKILEYIAENKDVFQVLLTDNGDTSFQKRVMNVAQLFLVNDLMGGGKRLEEDILKYLGTFIISGSVHTIIRWLKNDMDKSQKEMAEMINTFVNKGLSCIKGA